MSVWDWLQMQWARLNLWLDCRKEYPGEKISIKHVEGKGFRIIRMRIRSRENGQQWEAGEAEHEAEVERRKRLEALMTPEQRAAEEAKRARIRASRGQGGK